MMELIIVVTLVIIAVALLPLAIQVALWLGFWALILATVGGLVLFVILRPDLAVGGYDSRLAAADGPSAGEGETMSEGDREDIMSAYDKGECAGVFLTLGTLGLGGVVAFIARFVQYSAGKGDWMGVVIGAGFGLLVGSVFLLGIGNLLAALTGSKRLRRWFSSFLPSSL